MPTATALQFLPAVAALGLDVEKAVYDEELEPLVYLLASAGAELGYHFEWEVFGPYSGELVRDLSEITDQDLTDSDLIDHSNLDPELVEPVERVRALVEPPASLGLKRSKWLRLLAAVHFLEQRSGIEVGNGKRVPFVNRHFDETDIAAAKERLSGSSLLPQ
jgi:hypothetical protein